MRIPIGLRQFAEDTSDASRDVINNPFSRTYFSRNAANASLSLASTTQPKGS